MKTFYLEYVDDDQLTEITVEDRKACKKFDTKGFFEELEYGDDDFIYHYNHGCGSGSFKIPAHIVFSLPDLLLALNAERKLRTGIGMYGKSRLYEKKPVGQFPGDE